MYYGKHEIGKVIRRLRIEKQLSLEKLAENCGVDSKFITEVEEELHPDLDMKIFFHIAFSFNMRPSELLNEIEQENKDYYRRLMENERDYSKIFKYRRRRKELAFQKEITHNFKNKHSKQPHKMKKYF
jgi:transcriptional regulator with XRE-family HTH domain